MLAVYNHVITLASINLFVLIGSWRKELGRSPH